MTCFSRKERVQRLVVAMLSMVIGSGAVLTLVLTMNDFSSAPQRERETAREFSAPERKTPPKQPKKRPERKQRQLRTVSKAAPAPVLSNAISGLSFGLPGLEQFGTDEAMNRLMSGKNVSDVVMTAAAVDEMPKPLFEGRLEYPDRARRRNIEGYVVINMLINGNGNVEQVRVLEASPQGVFEEATLAWARQLTFTPAYYGGKPVKTWARRRIPFKLGG